MKKQDWLLLGAVAAYSYLFYEQSAGINFLLFTLILLAMLAFQTNKWVFRKASWQITAIAAVVSSISIVLVNSGLSVLVNCLSLILLAGFSRMPETSIFVAALNSMYSVFTSLFHFIFFRQKFFPESTGGPLIQVAGIGRQQVAIVGIPLVVTATFLVIYCSASAAFSNLVGQIDLSFISISWMLFTLCGFWILFGFFRQHLISEITVPDLAAGNQLVRTRRVWDRAVKMLGLKYEYKGGVILLGMLNLLLLVFNFTDAYYLAFDHLPAGLTYADFLHQGVNMLIFSIVLAIAVLLYLFRGNQNFLANNQTLKMLAYAWLAQNLVLVLLTLTKNSIYVMDFGLTYKRIGVYTYLTLTAIGLITSVLKVAQVKNQWFLFRANAWALYLVLVVLSAFNWDRIITQYNLTFQNPDLQYLTTLSDSNLALLRQSDAVNQHPNLAKVIDWRIEKARKRLDVQDWQSWNYNDQQLQEELQ